MAGGKRQRSDWMIADSGCVQVEESTRQFTGVIPAGRDASRQQAGRQEADEFNPSQTCCLFQGLRLRPLVQLT